MDMGVSMQLYLEDRVSRGELERGTAGATRSRLRLFVDGVGGRDKLPREVTGRDLDDWERAMVQRGLAPSSRRLYWTTARTFWQWLIAHEYASTDVFAGRKAPKQPRSMPRALPAASVAKLLRTAPDHRGQLICLLMVQECLRAKEVAGLQMGDVDELNRTLLVTGKGGHQRVVPVSDETMAALRRYVDTAGSWQAGPLIRSYKDPSRGVGAHYVSRQVSAWCSVAGIKARPFDGVAGHALRHTGATDMVRNGAPLPAVQAALGHQSLATTTIYTRMAGEDLRQAMAGRSYKSTAPPPGNPAKPAA